MIRKAGRPGLLMRARFGIRLLLVSGRRSYTVHRTDSTFRVQSRATGSLGFGRKGENLDWACLPMDDWTRKVRGSRLGCLRGEKLFEQYQQWMIAKAGSSSAWELSSAAPIARSSRGAEFHDGNNDLATMRSAPSHTSPQPDH